MYYRPRGMDPNSDLDRMLLGKTREFKVRTQNIIIGLLKVWDILI